jgi:hypothetical protein
MSAMLTLLLPKVCGYRPGAVFHSLLGKVSMAAAMLVGTGLALSAGSAQAGLFNWGELFPTSGTGACNGSSLDPRCVKGNMQISNFATDYVLSPSMPDTRSTMVNFTEMFGIWDFNVTFLPDFSVGGPFSISYDIEITEPGRSFKAIGLDSICILANSGPCSVTKEIAYYVGNALQPVDPSLTQISINGGPEGPSIIGASVRKIRITDRWVTTNPGILASFSNNFTQANDVPGPLPLLGVGAAFAFSRRLRRRISASKGAMSLTPMAPAQRG